MLERTLNDRGVLRTEISVEDARETMSFFGSTSADGGWRVCIVDTVDELNANSANALLKVLEEPPARSLFLLVSNAPGARPADHPVALPQTAAARRSRAADVVRAVADATGISPDDSALKEAAGRAEGSVARALMLLGGETLGLQHKTEALLKALPQLDPKGLHGLGDSLDGQRPGGVSGLHRHAGALDGARNCAAGPSGPAPSCAAVRGVGKDQPRRARDPGIQLGTQTAGFFGVRNAC